MRAALLEAEARAGHQVLDGAGHQRFIGARQRSDTCGDVDRHAGEVIAMELLYPSAQFVLYALKRRPHAVAAGLPLRPEAAARQNGAIFDLLDQRLYQYVPALLQQMRYNWNGLKSRLGRSFQRVPDTERSFELRYQQAHPWLEKYNHENPGHFLFRNS